MNHNRILRVLNVLFVSFGYQVQWFRVNSQKFQLTLLGVIYFIFLAFWYAICFQQHFADSSIFCFLEEMAPTLYRCIRLHLLMGIKVMAFAMFEMRHVTRALNAFIKALSKNTSYCWSRNELIVYIYLSSGFLINFGFAIYVMVQMEFILPTLQQVMHFTAMCVPHFALASSFKLLNVTAWIVRVQLQNMHTEMNLIFNKKITCNNESSVLSTEDSNANSVELSVISKHTNGAEIHLNSVLLLNKQLVEIVTATQKLNKILQKQMMLLLSMNFVCLLGATYSIVNYNTTWYLILEGPLGRSLLAFNSGVFVFICWDYICLTVANYLLQIKKLQFIEEIVQIITHNKRVKEDTLSLLSEMRYVLKNKLKLRIFFNSPIAWETFLLVNTLYGLAVAIFMVYLYFKDQIEILQIQVKE